MTIQGIDRNEPVTERMDSSRAGDVESKGIQNEITAAQQQLQKLSSDQEMTAEEKKQKRQDVQKRIADLNRELRKRQMELRRERLEEQENKKAEKQELNKDSRADVPSGQDGERESVIPGEEEKEKENESVFPQGSMTAIVSAGMAEDQAGAQGKVAMALEGTARIVQSEIDRDAGRGQNTERKKEALKSIENRASNASRAQMGFLADATQNMRRLGLQNDRMKESRTEMRDDSRIAAFLGGSKEESAKNAIQRYHAGKRFSSVTFHV